MVNKDKSTESKSRSGKRDKLPPKGTAARLRYAVGLWSDKSPEEIEEIKRIIRTSRRSAV